MLEPLEEEFDNFQKKTEDLLKRIEEKKQINSMFEKDFKEEENEITNEINSLKESIRIKAVTNIFEQWIGSEKYNASPNKNEEDEDMIKDENEEDDKAMEGEVNDLKNLNVSGKMKVIVETAMWSLQQQASDPVFQIKDSINKASEEMQCLQQAIEGSNLSMKTMLSELELSQKKLEKDIKQAETSITSLKKKIHKGEVIKQEDIAKLKKLLENNEDLLKVARDSCIAESKKAFTEIKIFNKKDNSLNEEQNRINKQIQSWLKELVIREKEAADLKKHYLKLSETNQNYNKYISKVNMQYVLKLQEFEKYDNSLQFIKDFISQNQNVEEIKSDVIIIPNISKMRLTIISAGNDRKLALPLLNMFLKGQNEVKENEDIKGFSCAISVKDSKEVEFNIWHVGIKDDIQNEDEAYFKNVEAVLIVYNQGVAKLEDIAKCVTFLNDKVQENCFVIVAAIGSLLSKNEEEKMIKEFLEVKHLQHETINTESVQEVKELFFKILYARFPDLYEG